MTTDPEDVIDHLAGIAPGSPLDRIRAARVQARDQAQASYRALFRPAEPGDAGREERAAVAMFVAGLHGSADHAAFYARDLPPALAETIAAEARAAATRGPYGHYPAPALAAENRDGPAYAPPSGLAPRLAAALAHAHMLVFHPRDASPAHLQRLLDAGWTTTGIVTLSQIVAFLAFQVRVVEGLRVMAALAPSETPA